MEATASRGGVSIPSSSSPRKEWRALRNPNSEDMERSKLGQSDERTIYEQGREPLDMDFCSITVDESLDNEDLLQQRLHEVGRQREELQQVEIGLRAQLIAAAEITKMQNTCEKQIKEHANAAMKLQEQLHEREQTIHELERRMEEKDRELHAIKLDNEAAWAKEDLFREQNKELATYRRERDNSEAERAQHLKQIHDLQEHIQEKERQFLELQEQHRVAQETILFRDEQLREAQAWIARVQEMESLQSTTNHSLQAELRDRTEQYNQLWLGCQRQFAEMERLHLHTVQQLQLELADLRDKSGNYAEESRASQTNSKDASQFGQSKGTEQDLNEGTASNVNSRALSNGTDNVAFGSTGNQSTQNEHVAAVPMVPSSLFGVPAYLPPGQVTALHPFVMHQPGNPHSVPSHVGPYHSIPAVSSLQNWQNQQDASDASKISNQNQYQSSQSDQNLLRSDAHYNYEISMNGQAMRPDYLDVHLSQGVVPDSAVQASTEDGQIRESIEKSYVVAPQVPQNLQQISSQFPDALRLEPLERNTENKEVSAVMLTNHAVEGQTKATEHPSSAANSSTPDTGVHSLNYSDASSTRPSGAVLSETFVSTGQTDSLAVGKTPESTLLDERSLLACIVRTIPGGGRIRISTTLPNRLGKMLAPLHWYDYKKKYGKLDDFVAGHPELFVIEGDYIQLRDGAQEIIAATTAVAKVAAAAAAPSPYSSFLPTLAVTPMAQNQRLKKVLSIDAKPVKTVYKEYPVPAAANVGDNPSQLSAVQKPLSNGFNVVGGLSNVKILSKTKDPLELNGSETRPQSSVLTQANGATSDKSILGGSQTKGTNNGRSGTNFVGRHPGRTMGAPASTSRR
ncbi:hypothetical protein RJ641_033658 [Dillenia turbinata]|uniref:DUF7725 domain-containing protein n=1 Tax=Dillenia turbinata TaxID=194707 RepID=A0AAN8VYL1_9MAGN